MRFSVLLYYITLVEYICVAPYYFSDYAVNETACTENYIASIKMKKGIVRFFPNHKYSIPQSMYIFSLLRPIWMNCLTGTVSKHNNYPKKNMVICHQFLLQYLLSDNIYLSIFQYKLTNSPYNKKIILVFDVLIESWTFQSSSMTEMLKRVFNDISKTRNI